MIERMCHKGILHLSKYGCRVHTDVWMKQNNRPDLFLLRPPHGPTTLLPARKTSGLPQYWAPETKNGLPVGYKVCQSWEEMLIWQSFYSCSQRYAILWLLPIQYLRSRNRAKPPSAHIGQLCFRGHVWCKHSNYENHFPNRLRITTGLAFLYVSVFSFG